MKGLKIAAFATIVLLAITGSVYAGGAKEKTPKRVGVVELYNNPYWIDAERGIHVVADPLGISITALNSNGDPATQAQNVTNLISAHMDGIIIGPVAPAGAVADLTRIKQSNIDAVCGDSCAPEADAKGLVIGWATSAGADLGHGVGKAAATYIKDKLGGKATIAMVVCDSLGPVCSIRHDAINQELAAVPDAKVVAMQDAFQTEKAQPLVVDMLTANPQVNVIITNNQGGTEGAVAAVKQLGLAGKVVVFGIDMTNVAANYLLEEPAILMYTVGQDSFTVGKVAMQMLVDKWNGKTSSQFKVIVPVQEFPRENVAAIKQYLADHKGQ
jgi:sugar transport system substrate-binding protein